MQVEPGDILTSGYNGRFADLYMVLNNLRCVFIGSMNEALFSPMRATGEHRYIWNATSGRFDIFAARSVVVNNCSLMPREASFEIRLQLATHGVD